MRSGLRHLLIVGDSIALGVTDMVSDEVRGHAAECFVDRLARLRSDWQIEVDAALHRTTQEAVARLPGLLQTHRPDVVLLLLGGNDLDINWKRFILSSGRRIRPNTPVEQFEINLRQMTTAVQQSGAVPLLSDLPAPEVYERGRLMSAATGHDVVKVLRSINGQAVADALHGQFSARIELVAKETATPIARWAEQLNKLPPAQRVGPDAVHPGEAAHSIIAEVVADLLAPSESRSMGPLVSRPS